MPAICNVYLLTQFQRVHYSEKERIIIEKFKSMEELIKGDYKEYRYSGSFECAPILGYYIKSEQIAKLR